MRTFLGFFFEKQTQPTKTPLFEPIFGRYLVMYNIELLIGPAGWAAKRADFSRNNRA